MDQHGDIQDRDEVVPASDVDSWFDLVQEALEQRGRIHVYYPNHRDQDGAHDDIHLNADTTYLVEDFGVDDQGLIFVQDGDVQRWLDPSKILFAEAHY